jgi:phage-related minor tail protein
LIQHEDWKGKLSTINDKEAIVRKDSEQVNTVSSRQQLEGLSERAKASLKNVRTLLSAAAQML